MFLLDKNTLSRILGITSEILRNSFFYAEECIDQFLDALVETLSNEYVEFFQKIDEGLKKELKCNHEKRVHFTSYFVSYHMQVALMEKLHFIEMEIRAFNDLIPKYTGVHTNDFNNEESSKRKGNRSPFKAL